MVISFSDASWRLNFAVDSGLESDGHYHGQTYGVALADIDGDGWLDLYANHHLVEPSEILYGFGAGNTAVTSVQLDPGDDDQHGATFFDIDHDGDLDLLESVGAGQGSVTNPDNADFWNKVLVNEGGRITTNDVARDLGLDYGPSRGRILVPMEIDGKAGIFLGSAARDDHTWPSVIMLQQADGDFAPWSESMAISDDRYAVGVRLTDDAATDFVFANLKSLRIFERDGSTIREATVSGGTFSEITDLVVADFDGDLAPEIFVGQGWGRRDKLLVRGANGNWSDQAAARGISTLATSTISAVAGDFDNDGDQDIAALQFVAGLDLVFWINDGSGHFTLERITRADVPGKGSCLVAGDVNNDGVLDLIAATGDGAPIQENAGGYFLLEGAANGNNWLSIALRGKISETDGLGARVFVRTPDGREQVLEQDSGSHQWAQDDTRLHFGLGSHDSAEVRVVWADGTEQQLGIIAANQRLTVIEDRTDPGDSDEDTPLVVSLTNGRDQYVSASGKDHIIHGLRGSDTITTGTGDDKLVGGAGNDNLKSGAGDDTINGGSGVDRLIGGSGSDTLRGGSGEDGFVFRARYIVPGEIEVDTIRDFTSWEDTIRLVGFQDASIDDLEFSYSGRKAQIVVDDIQTIVFSNLRDHAVFDAHDLIVFA
jgi:Ca2+-binding RTX toxin-like protein